MTSATWKRIGLLVGLGLFFWILSTADLSAVWRQVRNLHWRFGLIFLFYGFVFWLDTQGWRFALTPAAQSRLRWGDLFRTRLAGEAVNYVTPAAWIGGEPVKAVLLLRRHGIPLADGMASVVVAKTTFVFSMLLFVLTGLGVAVWSGSLPSNVVGWIWVVFPAATLLMGLFLIFQFFKPFTRGSNLIRWMGPGWLKKVAEKVLPWDQAIDAFYRQSPKAVFLSLAFHFLGWLAGVMEVYLILRFLQIPVSLTTAWSIEAVWVLLRAGAFLIPASLGASEGISLAICVGLGIGAVSGVALGLVRRARELLWVGLGLVEFSRG